MWLLHPTKVRIHYIIAMKPTTLLTTAISCLLGLAGSLHADELRLWGRVLSPVPIPANSWIVASSHDSCALDDHGNFSFPALPRGPLQLQVALPGCLPLRHSLYLRQEHFLELQPRVDRPLTPALPREPEVVAGASLSPLSGDLDGDGIRESLGSLNGLRCAQSGAGTVDERDLWGGWPLSRRGSGLRPAGADRLNPSGFFGYPAWTQPAETQQPGPVPLPGFGLRLSPFSRRIDIGMDGWLTLWQRWEADLQVEQGSSDAADQLQASLALRHHWNLPGHWQLHQQFGLSAQHLGDLDTQEPGLYLHLPGSDALRDAELEQRQLDWRGALQWAPGPDLRLEGAAWIQQRTLDSDALELDLGSNRLIDSTASGADWFATRREETRTRRGLRLALDQLHPKGRLQVGSELEQQLRSLDGTLLPESGQLNARTRWLSLEEERVDFRFRLRDLYRLRGGWSLDAILDLDYSYYAIARQPIRLFGRTASPDVDLSQDLLALNPELALRWQQDGWLSALSMTRRQRMLRPEEWWNAGESPEDPWAAPLVNVEGDQANQALLAEPEVRELAWELGLNLRQWELGLRARARRWERLPLTRFSMLVDPFNPLQSQRGSVDADQGILELGLGWQGTRHHWQLGLSRSWLRHDDLVHWRSLGSGQWLPVAAELEGLPQAALWALEVSWQLEAELLDLPLACETQVHLLGPRDALDDYRESERLDPQLLLDLRVSSGLSPAWEVALEGHAVWGDSKAAWRRTRWSGDSVDSYRHEGVQQPASIVLELTWRPGR